MRGTHSSDLQNSSADAVQDERSRLCGRVLLWAVQQYCTSWILSSPCELRVPSSTLRQTWIWLAQRRHCQCHLTSSAAFARVLDQSRCRYRGLKSLLWPQVRISHAGLRQILSKLQHGGTLSPQFTKGFVTKLRPHACGEEARTRG